MKFFNPFKFIAGKKRYQKFFEWLHELSLQGMNIGSGSKALISGEAKALEYVNAKLLQDREVIIFDVGAHTGQYADLVLSIFGNKVNLYCFEPSKITFDELSKNVTGENIHLNNFALGEKVGNVLLYTNKDKSKLASIYKRRLDHFNIEMGKSEKIAIKTLDTFCKSKKINHINLLKLDVEGHELNVLNGAKDLLNKNSIEFIQFEFGGCNIDSRTYFQDFYYLLNEQYYLYRIMKDGLYPICEYKEMYESFMTTNYLAERK